MTKQDGGLFLLEALVDKIVFVKSPCFSDKDFRTCVNVQCLDVDPLEIFDDDPVVAKSGGPFVKIFNSGKSCLFSLKESDIANAMSKFPIHVSVSKSLPCGCLPTKIVMGEATIDMTKEFVEARQRFLQDPNSVTYQALKDSFRFTGPDGEEAGEIVMFLRISCFGKLITTRFQSSSGPPQLGAGGGSTIIDRSCNPPKAFQSKEGPCACGAAHGTHSSGLCPISGGGGRGPCPKARNTYNSMPCEDSDDTCFCSGVKQQQKQPMECRNTDQYCLHLPKGSLPRLPFYQDIITAEQRRKIATGKDIQQLSRCTHLLNLLNKDQIEGPVKDYNSDILTNNIVSNETKEANNLEQRSNISICTLKSKRRSVSFSDTIDTVSETDHKSLYCSMYEGHNHSRIFGEKETTVYMTLFDDYCRSRTSGTQATASINKCLQVARDYDLDNRYVANGPIVSSNTRVPSTILNLNKDMTLGSRYHDIYFFGKKKDNTGQGNKDNSRVGIKDRIMKITAAPVQGTKQSASTNANPTSTNAAQTKIALGSSAGTNTTGKVSIKSEKCPATEGSTKGDMVATVSHIRIGPRTFCPIHGREPCQGPNCILATTPPEQAPVKVTQSSNPRRGVFELVIRRMTGAPLAKNELMLEWTPPPCRMPTCATPPCAPGPCGRPSKYKMIVCRPAPCRPKCCKRKPCGPRPIGPKPCATPCGPRPCKRLCGVRLCGPVPCRPDPCRKFCITSSRENPCISYSLPCKPRTPCKPCPLPCCTPCAPTNCAPCLPQPCKTFCAKACCQNPCSSPCKSTPCLRPCPVGRRRYTRKARSQPKIRAHSKRISPCHNRSSICPVVRCRSVPEPCFSCCAPLPCAQRKCCSVRPAKCCKSSCATCC